jgi:hypothetical protein
MKVSLDVMLAASVPLHPRVSTRRAGMVLARQRGYSLPGWATPHR